MAKGNTWCKIKRTKMEAQQRQARFGSYTRLADNADRPVPRDGRNYPSPEPHSTIGPLNGFGGVVVRRLPAGRAEGLERSIGAIGKGGRVASKSTGGNGTRIRQGLTPGSYICVTELIPSAYSQ